MDGQITDRVRLIAEDRSHGAGWLARRAVEALMEAVETGQDPLEAGRRLAAARPGVAAVAGALGRVLAAGRTNEQLLEECAALLERGDRAATSIAVLAKPSIAGEVLTHSASATVREALLYAEPDRVVCTLARPFEEGRAFSEELRAAGLSVDLVAEEDAATAAADVDVVLVGANGVFRDGSLLNRAGTRALAEAASEADVPVLVASETLKLVPADPPAEAPEDGPDDEPRFELTPPELIDRYVTDEGELAPGDIAALVDQTPFLREGYDLLHGGPST